MRKFLWVLFFFIIVGIVIYFSIGNNLNNNYYYHYYSTEYTAEKTSTENNNQIFTINLSEKEISYFSTKLPNDTTARAENIQLACNTLNGTIVNPNEEFSLWAVLGKPTKEKGYKKAKTFVAKKIKKTYGGGICQVSTTLYNAVLQVEQLQVTERHEHSKDVSYIEDGKDAAVSFGSLDFKFKNTLDTGIRIEAKLEDNQVKVKLYSN